MKLEKSARIEKVIERLFVQQLGEPLWETGPLILETGRIFIFGRYEHPISVNNISMNFALT